MGNAQHVCGLVSLADEPRRGARDALAALRREGIERIVMLTGDHAKTAAEVAHMAGLDAFHADLLPQDKAIAAPPDKHRIQSARMRRGATGPVR